MPTLFVATNGLSVWTRTDLGETLARMPTSTALYSGSGVWALLETPAGLMAGTDSGIFRWDASNSRWLGLPSPRDVQVVTALAMWKFYDWLAKAIRVDGIAKVERATEFDNKQLTSAGIRLSYKTHVQAMAGLREGVLLEVGFDDVTPNAAKDISSWLYDHAADKIQIIDNRAKGKACYDPGYTFVKKLQTVSTKFRQQQVSKESPVAFMRHYYDIYSLLQRPEVQKFIGTKAYKVHKEKRFRGGDNLDISKNEAFILSDPDT